MNGEIEKERNQTTGLLIINAIIWIPLIIIILLIIGVAKVNAESYTYRQRVYDAQDTLLNENTSSGINGNGKAVKFYTNITRDSSIPQGQFMNIYINYAVAYRFTNSNINETIRYVENVMYVYNNNTYDITDSCTRTQVIERETGNTNFNRFRMTISCSNIPTQENISAILIVSRPIGNVLQMAYATNVTYALQVNDVWFKSTSDTTDTDKILINNNENFNKLMEENTQNTDRTIEAINNINQVCNTYDFNKNSIALEDGFLRANGTINTTYPNDKHTSDYINITGGKTYQLYISYGMSTYHYCLYDTNKNLISCTAYPSQSGTMTITPNQNGYIRYSLSINGSNQTNFNGEYCYNTLSDFNGPGQPNTESSTTAFNKEDEILNTLEFDFELETPQIDTTANNLIWDWVHRLLFTNTIISGCVIALLTFGVIKLILGR